MKAVLYRRRHYKMKKKMNAVEAQPIVQESRVEKVATQPVVATQFAMPAHPILKESGDQPGAGKLFGYIRVSSREQNEARQVVALHNFGITDDHIFLDKQSGKDFNRPAYQALLRQLNAGDVLVVKSIDRLGRNYEEILAQWRIITKDLGADIVVLDMDLLDTRRGKDLTGTLIADIVLQLLSYVAETERAFIRQRQREGIAAAKSRGVKFGPPQHPRPAGFDALAEEWRAGRISAREAGRRLGVPHTTFQKWAKGESWAR